MLFSQIPDYRNAVIVAKSPASAKRYIYILFVLYSGFRCHHILPIKRCFHLKSLSDGYCNVLCSSFTAVIFVL